MRPGCSRQAPQCLWALAVFSAALAVCFLMMLDAARAVEDPLQWAKEATAGKKEQELGHHEKAVEHFELAYPEADAANKKKIAAAAATSAIILKRPALCAQWLKRDIHGLSQDDAAKLEKCARRKPPKIGQDNNVAPNGGTGSSEPSKMPQDRPPIVRTIPVIQPSTLGGH